MKYAVASVLLCISLIPAVTLSPTRSQTVNQSPSPTGSLQNSGSQSGRSKSNTAQPLKSTKSRSGTAKSSALQTGRVKNTSRSQTLRICQGVPIPDGYVIVDYQNSPACPHGAYVLKKDDTKPQAVDTTASAFPPSPSPKTAASRPRKVGNAQPDSFDPKLSFEGFTSDSGEPALLPEPKLGGISLDAMPTASSNNLPSGNVEEVGEGDIVRIDTNLVTVPVTVLDRQGAFVPNLQRENFTVFENGVEQKIAIFENTEKPFTVALLLDTSGSTVFHLWEIKEAAIAFAKQLRAQDRVLVVTFNQHVVLLTEATNDLNTVTEVIQRNANTGFSTRLYDAIALVTRERLNKISGRKAIVLFTDGVDTASYLATYKSTLREAEELDALIYPVQYDTTDFIAATQSTSNVTIVTRKSNWPFPGRTSSRVIYGPPTSGSPGSSIAEYRLADRYLQQLADKTAARLYKANDRTQLAEAFSKIAAELRCQYSLGYYPQTTVQSGERRLIRVRVDQPDLAVRARDSYLQSVPASVRK